MVIKNLSLQNFRNYRQRQFEFTSGITVVVGSNASGKTNLLEAIYLLATGKSFRAGVEKEMISYEKEIARVKGEIKDSQEVDNLEIVLTTGQVRSEKVAKKKYLVNGVGRRMMDFVGHLRAVYFGPEDLEIVVDSPSIRRDYLDSVLEQVDRDYRRASLSYKKGLRQRNKILERMKEGGIENFEKTKRQLYFWNNLLIKNGGIIAQKREELIDFINSRPDYFYDLVVSYQKSVISPARLEKYGEREVAAGMTLIGPHRDDIKFKMPLKEGFFGMENLKSKIERDLSIYGSRGEQRLAVFCLKLAELEFVAEKSEKRPVLLLDDIFSELDHQHRERLLEIIPKQQTIITTTDLHQIELEYRKKIAIIELK